MLFTDLETVLEREDSLLEGPRLDALGRHLFSDVGRGGVFAHRAGEVEVLVPRRRGVGGLVEHARGGLVITGRDLLHVVPGRPDRVVLPRDGFVGFNDLHPLGDGRLLVGALRFRPMAGESPVPGAVLLVEAEGRFRVLTERLLWPNGIGLSPDGARVFVSDFADGRVWTLPVEGGEPEEFARMPAGSADGLAVDAEGGVWVALGAAGGIARFEPDGRLDAVAGVPTTFVSSLSFGGADGRDVLVTAAGGLLTARADVPGVPVPPAGV